MTINLENAHKLQPLTKEEKKRLGRKGYSAVSISRHSGKELAREPKKVEHDMSKVGIKVFGWRGCGTRIRW